MYSTEAPDQSGFNIFKVNLRENIEFFYTYAWNDELFERIIDSKAKPFQRNRFSKSKISIVKELQKYLEDIEIDISCKYRATLFLSDIYVFPSLKGDDLNNSNRSCVYREYESILNVIRTKKKILINGNKEYGKTALLKRLFAIFYSLDFFPVFIEAEKIKSADEEVTNRLIRAAYSTSYYNLNTDKIMQMEREKKVCLIDNFDETILRDKSQKAFLEYINTQFDIVVLTANSRNSMVDIAKNLETNDYISSTFFELELTALRSLGQSRLVEKWLLLEDPEQDTNSQEFDAKKRIKLGQIQSVLKNGYFNNTPLEFLLVLSYMNNSDTVNADYSRYSYIYDCLIREKINGISNKDTKEALAYRTLLELLAYMLYADDKYTMFNEQYILNSIADYNENYPPLKGTAVKIIQKLVKYNILDEKNDKYRFKYNYMYYYFAGSYIINILSPKEKEEETKKILSNLMIDKNYHIALFMVYSVNPQYEILPLLRSISDELLPEHKDFKYEDQKLKLWKRKQRKVNRKRYLQRIHF